MNTTITLAEEQSRPEERLTLNIKLYKEDKIRLRLLKHSVSGGNLTNSELLVFLMNHYISSVIDVDNTNNTKGNRYAASK